MSKSKSSKKYSEKTARPLPKEEKPMKPRVTRTVHQQFKELEIRNSKKKRVSQGVAVLSLILNMLILPGLGSLIGKRISSGIIQVILSIVGFMLFIFYFGIIGVPMMLVAWIWGIITGVNIVKESY